MLEHYKHLAEQFEAILDRIPALVFFKDLNNKFIFVNKYVADAYMKTKEELQGVSLYELYTKEEAEKYYQDDLSVIKLGVPLLNIEEKWGTVNDIRWVNTSKIPYIDDSGNIIGVIGVSIDITEKKHSDLLIQELLFKLESEKNIAIISSLTDGLTQIHNRKYFDINIEKQLLYLIRNEKPLSLLILDIDYFKKYNDFYGHVAGDSCLKIIAKLIQDSLYRPIDFVSRYGGEEFIVVLPDTCVDGAKLVADRIFGNIKNRNIPHEKSTVTSYVTVSIGGITILPKKGNSIEEIITLVDSELYKAKQNGRNHLEFNSSYIELEKCKKNNFITLLWDDSLNSGNEKIDKQHKELLICSNKIIEELNNNIISEDISIFIKLMKIIKEHFKYEEKYLIEIKYPEAEEHKKVHKSILAKIKRLFNEYRIENSNFNSILQYIVIEVVFDHLIKEDSKFFQYINTYNKL